MKVFNFIYNNYTPYGILPNGIQYRPLRRIMVTALDEYIEDEYKSPVKNYLEEHSSPSYTVNLINPVFFRSDQYVKGNYTFFVIEDFNNSNIDISFLTLKTLNQWNDFFIVLVNYNEEPLEEKVNELKKFKSENLINKNKIIYMSDIKPTSNIQWRYLNSNKDDLVKDVFIKKLYKKVNDINETKFI